jgi:glycosyltransferase involved in cell wall biosynthesis
MLRLTALIHTHNDALRLGRCLETVYPCDEIVVMDHGSTDRTVQIAREYGARVINAEFEASVGDYLKTGHWILCLHPHESLTEALAASLFEWKLQSNGAEALALAMVLREETGEGWIEKPVPQTRIVPVDWQHWYGHLPANQPESRILEGELLRFEFP